MLFERLLGAVAGGGAERRVTVVTSVGDGLPDQSLELSWSALPSHWRVQVTDDDDAIVGAARSAAARTDDLIVLAPLGLAAGAPDVAEGSFRPWQIPELALCEVAPELSAGGRVGTVLPVAALVGEASREARAAAMALLYPDMIVELDAHQVRGVDLAGYRRAGDGRAAVVMYGRQPPGGAVRFATLPAEEPLDVGSVIADIQRLRDIDGGKTDLGFVTREPIRPGDPLNPGYYSPEMGQHRRAIGQYGAVVPLSHVFTLTRVAEDVGSGVALRGDIILTPIGTLEAERFRLEEVGDRTVPPSEAVVLRPTASLDEHERAFIVAYLQSERAWRLYTSQGGTSDLDVEALARVPVVLPTEPVRLTLEQIEDARTRVRRWDGELEGARERLLDIDTASGGLSEVLILGRRVRQRVFAGARLDDLGYRVRTQFPWPLAVLWRSVEAARPDTEGYLRTLEFAEAVACYVACLAITAAREAGVQLGAVRTTAARLSGTTRGVSFGDWTEILNEVRGRAFRAQIADRHLFPEISELASPDDDVDRALRRLKERRDALAHNRGPRTAGEVRDAHQQALADVKRWVEACEFVSAYPLWRIEATRWDELRGRNVIEFRELMGDNELAPLREIELDQATVENESLYAVSRDGALRLLRPLLTWTECVDCHRSTVMVLDQYSAIDGRLVIRSLDHGHTLRADALAHAFREVGLVEDSPEEASETTPGPPEAI